ncbi:MAG: hypothetical protein MRZ79_10720 [Bacteroidia bacterium]|nr:hypothetical protein [Bacteroidia bacterium]
MNRNYLIVIGLGIATIIAFLLINYFSQPQASNVDSEELVDLTNELESLDQSILELEIINETQGIQMENLKSLLNEKYTELNLMEDKIKKMESKVDELEEKGQLDEKTIEELRSKINETKANLVDAYKAEINILVVENSSITAAMDSAIMELNNTDQRILELTRENEKFEKALLDCNDADKIEDVKLPEFAELKVEGFEFRSIPKNSDSKSKSVIQYDKRNRLDFDKLERLNICFELSGNQLVPSGTKKLYLILTNPYGKTYTAKTLSGQTIKEGVTAKYTRDSELTYQQGVGKYNVCMDFIPAGDGKFAAGKHKVEIVYDGKVIGGDRFWIRK